MFSPPSEQIAVRSLSGSLTDSFEENDYAHGGHNRGGKYLYYALNKINVSRLLGTKTLHIYQSHHKKLHSTAQTLILNMDYHLLTER
jgi:hypothetical protein